MISFCIPIYNCDVSMLVAELGRQASLLQDCPYEIILIDDLSEECKEKNNELRNIHAVQYIELDQNVGRARIRNLFLNYAKFDYLLFLDCDSVIISSDFVRRYYAEVIGKNNVVCGGRVYPEDPGPGYRKLHWKYGLFKESMPADIRSSDPNKSFMTNNFLIRKAILGQIRFDERITKYGHEDTLYGYHLSKLGIRIKHIDNPVLHGSLEDAPSFVEKTETGIINLIRIVNFLDDKTGFIESVKILKYHHGIRPKGLLVMAKPLFYVLCPLIKYLLLSGLASLTLLDFYKFGYLTLRFHRKHPG